MFSEDILEYLQKEKQGKSFRELASYFQIRDLSYLNIALKKLLTEGSIFYKKSIDSYFIKQNDEFVGIFKDTKNAYGFIETEDKSFFVPAKFRLNALEGDTVKFKLLPKREEDQKGDAVKVLRVLKRNGNNIVGTIRIVNNVVTFVPDENYLKYECSLLNPENLKDGEVVIAKFSDFKKNIVFFKIISIISSKREDKFDWLVIANKFNLNLEFSDEAKHEANNEIKKVPNLNRKDLTSELIVTIDGIDSKDLDDAILVKKIGSNYLISVHIADVSFFLEKDSQLDYEAFQRATSVYLIDKVVPMLPEVLSNEYCSLNPNTTKLCISVDIEVDIKGNIINTKVYESKIISKYRLTYNEVDDFLKHKKSLIREDSKLSEMLILAQEVSQILRKKKIDEGMIDFKIAEVKVEIDHEGKPINIYQKIQTESEKIIEDLMVIANESIATLFENRDIKSLFRVHNSPSKENLEQFLMLSKSFGLNIDKNVETITNKDLMNVVLDLEGKPYESILKRFLIQTMEKAKYSDINLGHYALGLANYLHFTSPIRRYPDVIVHRTIRKYFIENQPINVKDFIDLEKEGKWCTEKEINSMQAERKLSDVKKAKFLSNKIGESFTGTIVSIMSYGIFVELDLLAQGMVPIENISLNKEDVFFDIKNKSILDKIKNITYKIGQRIKVTLKEVDTIKGNVSLSILDIVKS